MSVSSCNLLKKIYPYLIFTSSLQGFLPCWREHIELFVILVTKNNPNTIVVSIGIYVKCSFESNVRKSFCTNGQSSSGIDFLCYLFSLIIKLPPGSECHFIVCFINPILWIVLMLLTFVRVLPILWTTIDRPLVNVESFLESAWNEFSYYV